MLLNTRLGNLLVELESSLRALQLWQTTPPSAQALASQAPFAVDTLAPEQWLQWIFVPKMQQAIAQASVPRGFALEPYFAEAWQGEAQYQALLALIRGIDEVCQ
ncbi:YqcC family protein [Vibrio misgurnus]|uniref:YqcC family protein n=1 Tax=Vibrio TaxID=662 RepID=UPI0024162A2C|nr:YqcC family protein [Vibrio sp. gvc]